MLCGWTVRDITYNSLYVMCLGQHVLCCVCDLSGITQRLLCLWPARVCDLSLINHSILYQWPGNQILNVVSVTCLELINIRPTFIEGETQSLVKLQELSSLVKHFISTVSLSVYITSFIKIVTWTLMIHSCIMSVCSYCVLFISYATSFNVWNIFIISDLVHTPIHKIC